MPRLTFISSASTSWQGHAARLAARRRAACYLASTPLLQTLTAALFCAGATTRARPYYARKSATLLPRCDQQHFIFIAHLFSIRVSPPPLPARPPFSLFAFCSAPACCWNMRSCANLYKENAIYLAVHTSLYCLVHFTFLYLASYLPVHARWANLAPHLLPTHLPAPCLPCLYLPPPRLVSMHSLPAMHCYHTHCHLPCFHLAPAPHCLPHASPPPPHPLPSCLPPAFSPMPPPPPTTTTAHLTTPFCFFFSSWDLTDRGLRALSSCVSCNSTKL